MNACFLMALGRILKKDLTFHSINGIPSNHPMVGILYRVLRWKMGDVPESRGWKFSPNTVENLTPEEEPWIKPNVKGLLDLVTKVSKITPRPEVKRLDVYSLEKQWDQYLVSLGDKGVAATIHPLGHTRKHFNGTKVSQCTRANQKRIAESFGA